jgi:methionyl-tRNA formyltransferase
MKDNIIFFGSSNSSLKLIKELENNYNIPLVITTKHKNNVIVNHFQDIKETNVLEVEKLNPSIYDRVEDFIKTYSINMAVVVDFGLIIPADFIVAFKRGIINVHYSLLPKYRGASPIESAILADDDITGVSFMLIEPTLDSGPVLSQYEYSIKNNDNKITLTDHLDDLALLHINKDLKKYLNGEIMAKEQDHSMASFCGLIKKEDGLITEDDSAQNIISKVKAYYDWPSAWLMHGNKRIKIYEYGQVLPTVDGGNKMSFVKIGSSLYLQAKDALLEINKLQIEGKKAIDGKSAINGYKSFFNL